MLALGLGPIGIVELLMVLLMGAVQLAILFLIVYWAVRLAQRCWPTGQAATSCALAGLPCTARVRWDR